MQFTSKTSLHLHKLGLAANFLVCIVPFFFSLNSSAAEVSNDASVRFGVQGSFSQTQIGSFVENETVGIQTGEFTYSNTVSGEVLSHKGTFSVKESSYLCLGGTEAKLIGTLSSASQMQLERTRFRLGLSADIEKSGLDECRSGPRGVLGLGNDTDLQDPRFAASLGNSLAITERLNNDLDIGYTFFQKAEQSGTLALTNSVVYESSAVSQETVTFRYLRQGLQIIVSEEIGPALKHTQNFTEFVTGNAEAGFSQVTKTSEEDPIYLFVGGLDIARANEFSRLSARYAREISSRDPASPRFYTDIARAEASRRLTNFQDGGISLGARLEQGRISATLADDLRQSYEVGVKHFLSFYGYGSKNPATGLTSEYKLELTDSEAFKLIKQYIQTSLEWQF
jgi:hypothetical protein